MRQWDLIGITDADRGWVSPIRRDEPAIDDEHGTFFWSTDTALTIRTFSDAAAEALGMEPDRCEGRDLLTVFGIEGPNLAVLEAHARALEGREGRFVLKGRSGTVRCRVAPTHSGDGRVIGTFCLAIGHEDPVEVLQIPTLAVA